jgi:WD40 repeat protein/CHAT domain-containing protein
MILDNFRKGHRGFTFLMGVVFATVASTPISAQPRISALSQTPATENSTNLGDQQPVQVLWGQIPVFLEHEDWARSAVFSPDGRQILTASHDKTACLWDTSGNLLVEFRGHEDGVDSAVFSPDGRQILTASEDKTARLWDTQGNLLAVFSGHAEWIESAVFSPNGRQILTTSWDEIRLWDTQGNLLVEFNKHEDYVTSAVFSPDGRQILTASRDRTVRLWDTEGNLLAVFRGHKAVVERAVFSPDGHQVLTASEDKAARLWDTKGNLLVEFRGHEGVVKSAIFSPNGRQILTASHDKTARLWDTSGHLLVEFRGDEGIVESAVFSPDGRQILTASRFKTARLWDTKGNLLAEFRGHEGGVRSAVFSPDGRQILTVSSYRVARLWDVSATIAAQPSRIAALQPFRNKVQLSEFQEREGGQLAELPQHEARAKSAVFSPDGRQILTASWDKTARLWDTKGNLLTVFRGHEGEVISAIFSPDGRQILTASWDKTARLWDTSGNLLAVFQGHKNSLESAVFSPDGRKILTNSGAHWDAMRVWDTKGNLLAEFQGHEGYVNSAVFSPDGRQILTASWDKTARLWNTKGNLLAEFQGHEGYVNSAVFSPDGRQILTASNDQTARLWDTKGNLLVEFRGHEGYVNSAVFSPDGRQILTASNDQTTRLWDTKGNLLVEFRGLEREDTSAVFSPDGRQILTASSDWKHPHPYMEGTARLWSTTGNLLVEFRGRSKVDSSVFSPDGRQILTSSDTVRLWDVSAAILTYAPEQALKEGIQLSRQGTVELRQLSIQKLQDALAFYRETRNLVKAAQVLLLIGKIYTNLGQFQTAIDSYNQALSLSRQAGAKAEEAAILNSLGQLYDDLADSQTSLDYYNQALPLLYELNEQEGVATTLKNIGDIYATLQEWQKALEFYQKAFIISQPLDKIAAEADPLMGIGGIYIALKEWSTALRAYKQALVSAQFLEDKVKETTILNQLGKVHAALGQQSTALDYYDQALSLSRQLGYKTEEANILYNQATLNRQQNNLTAAKTKIETAIKIIEELRIQIASQQLRQSYFARNQDYYQFYIDLLMQLHQQNPSKGYDGEALHISERARARSLLELLSEASADIRQGVDPKLLAQERNLQQQLNDLEHRKYELLSTQHTQKELDEIKQKSDTVLAQLKQLEARIRVASPRYADLKYPEPLTLQQIQQQVLDDDTLLLEYSLGEDRSYLWAVSKTSITSYVLPKRSEIEAAAQTFRQSLTPDSAANLETGLPLSQMLLAPVANQLGNKRLLIVPDGALQSVPFAALPIPTSPPAPLLVGEGSLTPPFPTREGGSGGLGYTPLLVQNEIITLPSASTIAIQRRQLQNRPTAAKKLAVVADPIFALNDPRFSTTPQQIPETPANSALTRAARNLGLGDTAKVLDRLQYTGTEAKKILALVPATQHLQALDFDASRTTATNPNLAQYQIIHLATHGLLDPVNPELSGIVLSLFDQKGQSQDGFLRLHDIFNLNLPAELVVLSACETGLGKEVRGEGLVGLTRGFMYAGSRRVVVSLWSVNDVATSEVMAKFYQKMLQEGQNPVSALRAAQLEMWNSQQWQSPYYWAAFTIQGDWR